MTKVSDLFDPELTLPQPVPVTEISQDQKQALDEANSPSETNPYATINDIPKWQSYKALISQETTSQTSGALVVGRSYYIADFKTGDNFTNVGA